MFRIPIILGKPSLRRFRIGLQSAISDLPLDAPFMM
jgi:hypothetical protein